MKAGRVEEASSLAVQIGKQIVRNSRSTLAHIDGKRCAKELWNAVNQITGRKQTSCEVEGVTADSLNSHYAAMSTDKEYQSPSVKLSAAPTATATEYATEYEIFRMLDSLQPTATGLDKLPSWYLRLGAPVFSKPICWLFNRSIAESKVPAQWKTA